MKLAVITSAWSTSKDSVDRYDDADNYSFRIDRAGESKVLVVLRGARKIAAYNDWDKVVPILE